MADINAIIKDKQSDALGYFPLIQCKVGSFYVSAGPNCGCTPRERTGPWTHLEVGFPNGQDYAAIYESVRNMTDPESLTALYVPVELINEMISQYGGLAQ